MPLVLSHATVVHGDPAEPPRLADVLVDGSRIAAVGGRGAFDALDGARRIDLTDHTILPGLIDMHVHLCLEGDLHSTERFETEPVEWLVARAVGHAQQHLAAGVTTVRDLGGADSVVFTVRDAIASGLIDGPRVLAAGLVVTTTGGHGSWMGSQADTPAQVTEAVRGRIQAGADTIKIVATGGVHTQGSDLMAAQYGEAELHAAARAAHEAGLVIAAHASNPAGMASAALAGIDTIEHGVFLDDPTAALMAERHVTFVPTLAATVLYAPHADHPGIPAHVREKAALTVPAHSANFPRALRHGVALATGTDAGSTFVGHGLVPVEVELLTRFGVAPLDAIAAATRTAARALGLAGQIGSVDEGMSADLLVVRDDPLRDIAALQRPAMVIRAGRVVRSLGQDGPQALPRD